MRTLAFAAILSAASLLPAAARAAAPAPSTQPAAQTETDEPGRGWRPLVEQRRELPPFDVVRVSAGVTVVLMPGEQPGVVIKGDSALAAHVETRVTAGGKLRISFTTWKGSTFGRQWPVVYVTCQQLRGVEASGAADISSTMVIQAPKFFIDASASSDVKLDIEADTLFCDVSSAADIRLAGRAGVCKVVGSSAAEVKARELTAGRCVASVSSAAELWITAAEAINASVSSAAELHLYGSPAVVNVDRSSTGDFVRHRD